MNHNSYLTIGPRRVPRYCRVPEELSDLTPTFLDAVPTDPFDGEPLRYRVMENGYIVYSIGDNQRDDGGAERTEGGRLNYDWFFTVSHRP